MQQVEALRAVMRSQPPAPWPVPRYWSIASNEYFERILRLPGDYRRPGGGREAGVSSTVWKVPGPRRWKRRPGGGSAGHDDGAYEAGNARMFRIVISSEAAQQAEMFGDGGQSPPIVGPLPEAGGDVNSPAQASTCCSTPCPWRPSKVRKAPRCL
jgi:hypothetical protein